MFRSNELLKTFSTATKDLSGIYYSTFPRVLYHCCILAAQFNTCSYRQPLLTVIVYMVDKWLKYFIVIPEIFLIAKCLDPLMKYNGICQLIDMYYSFFSPALVM